MLNEAEIITNQDFDILINQSLEIKNEVTPNSIILYIIIQILLMKILNKI